MILGYLGAVLGDPGGGRVEPNMVFVTRLFPAQNESAASWCWSESFPRSRTGSNASTLKRHTGERGEAVGNSVSEDDGATLPPPPPPPPSSLLSSFDEERGRRRAGMGVNLLPRVQLAVRLGKRRRPDWFIRPH